MTIDDINVVTEMNTSQLATQQEEEQHNDVSTHGYNLRELPTKRKEQISLAIAGIHGETTGVEEKMAIHDNLAKGTCPGNAHPDEYRLLEKRETRQF